MQPEIVTQIMLYSQCVLVHIAANYYKMPLYAGPLALVQAPKDQPLIK